MESNKSAHLILLEKSWKFFKNFHLRKMSVGQKSLWIFAPRSKTDKRREQNQLLRKYAEILQKLKSNFRKLLLISRS